jgi:hypothetical protein
MARKKRSHAPLCRVALCLVGGALAQCGSLQTTCNVDNACGCFVGGTCVLTGPTNGASSVALDGAVTVAATTKFPPGLSITVNAGASLSFTGASTSEFCIPATTSYLGGGAIITVATGASVNMAGSILFNVGSVVPASVLLLNGGTENGVYDLVTASLVGASTNPAPCFTTAATPTYGASLH